ncbi:Transcriptional regulator, AcrR family [hydrothermal vent metagenome]|uniref:Transcriptional regulator, AcrR family n=1 Tax=hydrothermal vent metagenome TaxID=652676 RepID=A0A3B0SEC0_9ZZZZ
MASLKPLNLPAKTVRKVPKQRRSKKLVAAIMEATARILEDGDKPFTTNHIADRAGVSIGSLYQYFPSADAIMVALIEQHVADERDAAEAILAKLEGGEMNLMHDLLVAYIDAHANAPRLTAQVHALAPSFGLQDHLVSARDAQADRIAQVTGLPEADVQMAVMAVEGVVLATLTSHPERLKSSAFIDRLYTMVLAPLAPG